MLPDLFVVESGCQHLQGSTTPEGLSTAPVSAAEDPFAPKAQPSGPAARQEPPASLDDPFADAPSVQRPGREAAAASPVPKKSAADILKMFDAPMQVRSAMCHRQSCVIWGDCPLCPWVCMHQVV